MRLFTLATLLVVFSLIFAVPSYASGQSQAVETGFAISPVAVADSAITAKGYFIYKVQGSGTVTGSVLLRNSSSDSMTIQLAAVDAQTAQTGGSAFATSELISSKAGTWLTFTESSVTLPANMQKPVDFSMTVPAIARPGQYLAGISAYIPSIGKTGNIDTGSDAAGAHG